MPNTAITSQKMIPALASGQDLAVLRALNEETIDFIYAFSALCYARKEYRRAQSGFKFLARHKHRDPDMWQALAQTYIVQEKYNEAMKAYLVLACLRPTARLCLDIARLFHKMHSIRHAKIFISAAQRALLERDSQSLRKEITIFAKSLNGAQ